MRIDDWWIILSASLEDQSKISQIKYQKKILNISLLQYKLLTNYMFQQYDTVSISKPFVQHKNNHKSREKILVLKIIQSPAPQAGFLSRILSWKN